MSDIPYSAAKHPAPHRNRARLEHLAYGLFAAPIAWAGNFMIDYALLTHACYPGEQPLPEGEPGFGFAWWLAILFYVLTLGVCASAGYVSYSIWKEARQESEGHFHRLVEAGEGRTRFLAVVGIGFSALFVVATVFGIMIFVIEPLRCIL